MSADNMWPEQGVDPKDIKLPIRFVVKEDDQKHLFPESKAAHDRYCPCMALQPKDIKPRITDPYILGREKIVDRSFEAMSVIDAANIKQVKDINPRKERG